MSQSDVGDLIRAKRERLGLSQRVLALRAATTQAAVSRIERGVVSPTFETVRALLLAMGERPVLSAQRLPTNWDPTHMASTLERSPPERLALATPIPIVSRDDLIRMKGASGRPIDVSDVAALTEPEQRAADDAS